MSGHLTARIAVRLRDAIVWRAYHWAPRSAQNWWEEYVANQRTSRSPDRKILVEDILPSVARFSAGGAKIEILWIGCARYTGNYYRILERDGARCWTLDIDPRMARWGRRGRHAIGDLQSLTKIYSAACFDVVLCNGVFGYGINSTEAQREALACMADCLKPEGLLLLGWNTNKIDDPLESGLVAGRFQPAELPGFCTRRFVAGCTHVYDFLQRRNCNIAPPGVPH